MRQYIKVAILISVFAFSGYNIQACGNFNHSTYTIELVFSKNPQSGYQFNNQSQLKSTNILALQKQKFNSKFHFTQLNYGKLLEIKVKSYVEKNHQVFNNLISKKHKHLFSSNDDEVPLRSSI